MSYDNDSLVRLLLQRRNGPGLPGLGEATAMQYARYLRRLGRLVQGRRGSSRSNLALPDYEWMLQPRAVAACIEAGRGRAGYYSACYAALFSLCEEGEHAAALALYKERAALTNAPLASERSALGNGRSARRIKLFQDVVPAAQGALGHVGVQSRGAGACGDFFAACVGRVAGT